MAGPDTLKRLNSSRKSPYYTQYGARLTSEQWNKDAIMKSGYDDVDMLARVIFGESRPEYVPDGLKAIAKVLQNRKRYGGDGYQLTDRSYDIYNPSVWARIICKASQYATATGSEGERKHSRTPERGALGNEDNPVDPRWRDAVDLAKMLVNDETIEVSGYVVTGTTVSSSTEFATKDHMNQVGWVKYLEWLSDGTIDPEVTVLTASKDKKSNAICKFKPITK